MRRSSLFLLCFVWSCEAGLAQTTLGMIAGRIRDQATNAPVGGVFIEYEELQTASSSVTVSASTGDYYIPLLPPGSYRVRVTSPAETYQAREVYGVQVAVAGYVHVDFELRDLKDVWEKGRYGSVVFRDNTVLPFYGPDVDPSYTGTFEPERRVAGQLEPSLSDVLDPRAIATLPLAGRDIYAALVLQPGVTAQSTNSRSLGLSANGQRIFSSNFLLDGVEENDALLSGPALLLAPEMVKEYRVSTNNFSAEYGRTSGYLANAITRSATSAWHGVSYVDLNNNVLNANTFAHNSAGIARNSIHLIESGVSVGGALPHSRLLSWTALDYAGSRSFSDAVNYTLPTMAFAASLPEDSVARRLLSDHPPRQWASPTSANSGPVKFARPVTLRRLTALQRLDYALSQSQRIMTRFAGSTFDRPDFNWSPYGQAPLKQDNAGAAMAVQSSWTPRIVSEIRGSILLNDRRWNLAFAKLPAIAGIGNLLLPGNCCQTEGLPEGWRDRTRTIELSATVTVGLGSHLLKAGAGLLDVRPHVGFEIPVAYRFLFSSLAAFAADNPFQFDSLVSNTLLAKGVYGIPDTHRAYAYDQPYVFIQEDWKVSPILTLNAGLRYDRLSLPRNVGSVPDVLVVPGSGGTLDARIASASLATHTGALLSSRPDDLSIRLAFSLELWKARGTVIRGGSGTFFDRSLDNAWFSAAANDQYSAAFAGDSCDIPAFYVQTNYSGGPSSCPAQSGSLHLFDLTLFKPRLRSPLITSFFLSLQQPLARNFSLHVNGSHSSGRHLLTTDILNRQTGILPPANGLPNLDYRTDQGSSNYTALSTIARYRSSRVTLNAAYTWSHSIDNQSDPLLGEYFDLSFGNQTDRINQRYFGAFTFPGDTKADKGNSDFDQRQNFAGWISADLPSPRPRILKAIFGDWSAASVFAVRSGLPYTIYAGITNCFPVCNTRASLVNEAVLRQSVPIAGGVQLLNSAALAVPPNGENGNTGRNSFTGPGLANLDFSLSRSFTVNRFGEHFRAILRADAFNVLNHANLQNPEAYLGDRNDDGSVNVSPYFGTSLYGQTPSNRGFPLSTPLAESSRQIHLMFRLQF